jgi:hypothetical protein
MYITALWNMQDTEAAEGCACAFGEDDLATW